MKRVMNMSKRKYITRSLGRIAGLALVMLWSSCTGDEPSLDMRPTSTGSRGQIVVCGGKGDVVAQTRYVGPDDGTSGPQSTVPAMPTNLKSIRFLSPRDLQPVGLVMIGIFTGQRELRVSLYLRPFLWKSWGGMV